MPKGLGFVKQEKTKFTAGNGARCAIFRENVATT
jgi:hypothetical protein